MNSQMQANQCSTEAANQRSATERSNESNYRPLVDLIESKDELQIRADMPGVRADQLDLDYTDGVLTLTGHVAPRYTAQQRFHRSEYGVGDFSRTFRVGDKIDAAKMYAELNDGVLTVHLPKAEAAKPRKIEIRAGG